MTINDNTDNFAKHGSANKVLKTLGLVLILVVCTTAQELRGFYGKHSYVAHTGDKESTIHSSHRLLGDNHHDIRYPDGVGVVPVGNLGGTSGKVASLFEGDGVLTYEQAVKQFGEDFAESLEETGFVFLDLGSGHDDSEDSSDDSEDRRDLAARIDMRWPNRHRDGYVEIAYRFDTGTIPATDTARRNAARDAMDRLEDSGVVRFIERTTEDAFFEFAMLDASSCYCAGIGYDSSMAAGPQSEINLGWCNSAADVVTIEHELMHMLGFWHEQSRPDRDQFITVTSTGVTPNSHNWAVRLASEVDTLGSDYDYASFMHYPNGAFGGEFTFTVDNLPLPNCLSGVGQMGNPSWQDIEQLRLKYACEAGARSGPVPIGDYCTTDCRCWEHALGDCDSDDECQGDLICGRSEDPGPEGWVCEPGTRTLPHHMCRFNHDPVAVCQDIVRSANDHCEYRVSLDDVDGGSHDPDGHVVDPKILITSHKHLSRGVHDVTVKITDSAGLTDSCTATVEVVDDTEPEIKCPHDIEVSNDPGKCGAVVDYDTPEGTDNCDSKTSLTHGLGPGAFFPVGTTKETYTVVDEAGLSSSCSFTVTVIDSEPPVPKCVAAPNNHGKISASNDPDGFWTASVTDNCGVSDFDVRDTGSGTVFPGPFDPKGTDFKYVVKHHKVDQEGHHDLKLWGKANAEVIAEDEEGNVSIVSCGSCKRNDKCSNKCSERHCSKNIEAVSGSSD